jgi:hypothetical protein
VQVAAEADQPTVDQAATRGELRSVAITTGEVPPDPRRPVAEERIDARLRVSPAAAGRRRNGDDQADVGIDRDPEMARPGRMAERVGERRGAQRARPSRSVATAFSIRRPRVSSLFADSIGSTQKR